MTEEQQCYYMVRDDGSMTFYLHGGNGAHLVLIDTLDASAQIAKRDATIAQVTKILGGYPDSDLLSLATTVAAGYERWSDGYDAQVEALRAQVAERDAMIAEIIGDDNLENQYLFQIAELRGRVAKHKATIAERDATIAELRAQVATLTERLSRCTSTDDYGDVAE